LLHQALQRGDGLMDHLIDRAELHIMDLENVDVVGAQAAQRALKPSDHSRFAEIKLVKSVSATFRTQHHFVPASIHASPTRSSESVLP
jgi:hypothetical protein